MIGMKVNDGGEQREFMDRCKAISMLHQETLWLLYSFAARNGRTVLEIGPYIGGSTVAIASGLKAGRHAGSVLTVEAGTSYKAHPHIPTSDTVRDLRKNLCAFEVDHLVHVFTQWSVSRSLQEQI